MNSKRKRRGKQLPLPFEEAQDRPLTREPDSFYRMVCYVRSAGFPVFRISGFQARFNGRIVTNKRLWMIARKLGYAPEGAFDEP